MIQQKNPTRTFCHQCILCLSALKGTGSTSRHLVELGWVDPCCIVVEQQLIAELVPGHGSDVCHFEEVLNGSAAIDVHGTCVCSGLQQHLHQDMIAVPGSLVESGFMIFLLDVWIWTRSSMLVKTDPVPDPVSALKTHLPDGRAGGDTQCGGPGCRFALSSQKPRMPQSSAESPGKSWPHPQMLHGTDKEPAALRRQI